MRIAVDGMGGDHAPQEIVKGCVEAAQIIKDEIYIVGPEDTIRRELKKYRFDRNQIKIVHAPEVILNDDPPVKAARMKKDSSMIRSIMLVREKKCDFAISGGNTGALMAGALFNLGRIPGIDRPAIGMTYPILGSGVSFLVDAGANAECKPDNLLEFATMGSIYMNKVLGFPSPTVGLINIGSEEKKGTTMLKETYQLLKKSNLNFIGNVEARDVPFGAADVLVCDGFVGNTLSEAHGRAGAESHGSAEEETECYRRAQDWVALMLSNQLRELKRDFDYSEYGGAPILGVKGPVVKMHGSSEAAGVKSAIIKGVSYVEHNVVGIIRDSVIELEEIAISE